VNETAVATDHPAAYVRRAGNTNVGKISFEGTTMLPTQAVSPEFDPGKATPKSAAERQAWAEATIT
jgi:hypothetical protein